MGYVSEESGKDEVYVQSIPVGSGQWQISSNGGAQPIWRRDVPICWPGLHPPAKSVSNETKRILLCAAEPSLRTLAGNFRPFVHSPANTFQKCYRKPLPPSATQVIAIALVSSPFTVVCR